MRQGKQFFFKAQKLPNSYGNHISAPLNSKREEEELKLMQFMATIVYEQVTQDKPGFLQLWIMFFMALQSLKSNGSSMLAWQLKLLFAHSLSKPSSSDDIILVSAELALSVMQQVDSILSCYEKEVTQLLQQYYFSSLNGNENYIDKLALYLILYDFPTPSKSAEFGQGVKDPLTLCTRFPDRSVPPETCWKLIQLLKKSI
ncbi:hypothetical protein J437_LFUL011826 [Ladona fulva]|uniref:Anaphase-promoting complex subunit 1 C-terminal domain-containing protein n=1 Tax=Ladona fulva TaxID=123851 RepID=A0A8K0P2Z4_LADFU|nr:hypothetical protein J437_LFUL011826 [Ladona fulva]